MDGDDAKPYQERDVRTALREPRRKQRELRMMLEDRKMAINRHEVTVESPPDYEPPRRVTVEEYLEIDNNTPGKRYEYSDGWMWLRGYPPGWHVGMAGGTAAHSDLIIRVTIAIGGHLLRTRSTCTPHEGNLRLRISETKYYYPDFYVTCGEKPRGSDVEVYDASLVIEILSPGTAVTDLNEKLREYKKLQSAHEYLLLNTDRIAAQLYRKREDGWLQIDCEDVDTLSLESIGFAIDLAKLYEGMELSERGS